MSDLLTKDDLAEVTGEKRRNAQRKLLAEWGVSYRIRNDDSIMTTWSALNGALTSPAGGAANLKALRSVY